MKIKEFFARYRTPRRIILLSLLCMIPLTLIVLGIRSLLFDRAFTIAFLMLFFVLPLLMIVFVFASVGSSTMPVYNKILGIIAMTIVYVLFSAGFLFFGTFSWLDSCEDDAALKRYQEIATEVPELPGANTLGNPVHAEFYDYYSEVLIFEMQSYALFCQYGKVDYAEQKAQLDGQFTFYTEPIPFASGDGTCAPTDTVDGYDFRVAVPQSDDYLDQFPKRVIMIGTNDQTREIVYLYLVYEDLDAVDSLEELLTSFCGWRHMR